MAINSQPTPSKPVAYATLVTNDGYVDASMVVAKALRDLKTRHELVVLVTPDDVSEESRERLKSLYDQVIPVSPISGAGVENLEMIGRPDLYATMTKIQLWSQTQYSRILYLDADTLPLQNLDHLFAALPPSSVPFAAAPELGYPDTFNAGFMFLAPDMQTYNELCDFAKVHKSFDGGDQGLLNVFFGDGTRGHPLKRLLASQEAAAGNTGDYTLVSDQQPASQKGAAGNWYRLSFTYNMEMHRVYRLNIPAVLRYRDEHKVLHFIGKDKPWHFKDGRIDMSEDTSPYHEFYAEMVRRWWDKRRSLCQV